MIKVHVKMNDVIKTATQNQIEAFLADAVSLVKEAGDMIAEVKP